MSAAPPRDDLTATGAVRHRIVERGLFRLFGHDINFYERIAMIVGYWELPLLTYQGHCVGMSIDSLYNVSKRFKKSLQYTDVRHVLSFCRCSDVLIEPNIHRNNSQPMLVSTDVLDVMMKGRVGLCNVVIKFLAQ